jgi:hypothetical protein
MANRSGDAGDGLSCRWNQKHDRRGPLLLDLHNHDRTLVVRPTGELNPKTYEQLRDGLLKFAAEEPTAIVVDLTSMRTTAASLLTVFPTVHDRINNWPGVPLVLAVAHQPLRAVLDFNAIPRCVPTYPSVTEALEGLDAAPHRCRHQMQLLYDPASARLARRLAERCCHEWGISDLTIDAMVIASELTNNMVYHARSEGWLRLDLRSDRLTIAVADADPRLPQLRIPGLRAAGGRGLVLVDKLSRVWGTAPQLSGGKVVWAVLTVARQTQTTGSWSSASR